MQFNRRNINKRLRNGDIISSSLYSSNSNGSGSSSGGILSGNYLPATKNETEVYIVPHYVTFQEHTTDTEGNEVIKNLLEITSDGIKVNGEVSAFGIGSGSGETSGTTGTIDIEDNLTSNRTDAALSANMGRQLKEMIDENTILFKRNFVFEKNGKKEVVTLGKKYSFKPGEYMFKLDILVHGLENFTGFDYDGTAYTLRTSPQIGPHFDPKKDKYENRQFLAYNGKKTKKVILAQGQFKPYEKSFMWCGIAGKYFEELVIPNNPEIIKEGLYSSQIEVNDYANAQALLERRAFTSADIQDTYYMYFGPRSEKYLKVYNVSDENAWNFGGRRVTESLQTSGFLSWLENILKWALEVIHKVVKNWGVAIIVLTIILKLLMFPLSKKQSLGTVKMQELFCYCIKNVKFSKNYHNLNIIKYIP